MIKNSFLLLALIALILASCVQQMEDELRQQLMDEALEERIDRYRQQKLRECREEVMTAALWTVDSAFRMDPILIQLDSIDRPPEALKPPKPRIVEPSRDVKVEPILKEND